MKGFIRIFGLLWVSHQAVAGIIYGVNQIPSKYQSVHYPAYVQMGSFTTRLAAEQVKRQALAHTRAPIVIRASYHHYQVVAGPFRQASSLKIFSQSMGKQKQHSQAPRSKSSPTRAAVVPLLEMPVKLISATPPVDPMLQPHTSNTVASTTPKPSPKQSVVQSIVQKEMETNRFINENLYPEFSVLLGGTYVPNAISGQTLQLLPYEIGPYADTFTNQGGGGAFTWGLDAQYRFKLEPLSFKNSVFDSLGIGVNFYQIANFNQTGDVIQFNLPEFTNYTDTLGLNNLRIMANLGLDLHPLRFGIVPFIEGGIGGARTVVSYESTPISPVDSPNFTLSDATSWNFAYQVGVGAKYPLNTHVGLSFRYLYANMGKASSSVIGSSTNLATPLIANMSTQNFLFGLTYRMG